MRGIITLTTDFGLADAYQGAMKGAILSVNPGAKIVDITHLVAPGNIFEGALALMGAGGYFPEGTVHLGVVDPGVGTARRPVLIETASYVFVGPDNGLLTLAAQGDGIKRAVEITNNDFFAGELSATFHGRDLFAPVAAHLALGVEPKAMGPEIDPAGLVKTELPEPITDSDRTIGTVVHVDKFGNLITNIRGRDVGEATEVRLQGESMELKTTYGDVELGAVVALIGSSGLLEIAVNQGNAAEQLDAGVGCSVSVGGCKR